MKGILSGIEIAEAVERHKKWQRLHRLSVGQSQGLTRFDERLSLWDRLWLSRNRHLPRIHIDDFDPTPSHHGGRLGPNSYDLRIGKDLVVYDLGKEQSLSGYPIDPRLYFLDAGAKNATRQLEIPPSGYILTPGTLFLAKTVEYTESHNVVPYIDGRSSAGRLGIFLHVTAGRGDRGFCGNFTCEIAVVHPVRIYPNLPLCQITFHPITPRGWSYQGRYQGSHDVVASRLSEKQERKA